MTFRENLDPVSNHETLARFVVYKGQIRNSDQSVKPEAFSPHPHQVLSVTRHVGLTGDEVWRLGQDVAAKRELPLYGRADVEAGDIRRQKLDFQPTARPFNHANIIGWPRDKPAQKRIAQELAVKARFVPIPTTSDDI